ncbi:hypothetical protein CP8484711_2029A, partial [Chlamydia psittaci 84-8471/1]
MFLPPKITIMFSFTAIRAFSTELIVVA